MRRCTILVLLAALTPAAADDTRQGKTLPAWVEQLDDRDAKVRVQACQVLGDWGRKGGDAVGPLVKTLGDKDANVRYAAADALGRIGPTAKEAVAALLKLLKDDADAGVRLAALEALGNLGPSAAEALPDVLALTASRDTPMALAALRALRGLGQSSAEVTAALKKAAKDGDARVRVEALRTWAAVVEVVEVKDTDLETLVAALGDPQAQVRLGALMAWSRMYTTTPAWKKALLKLAHDPDPEVRREASWAIVQLSFEKVDEEVLVALKALLVDTDVTARVAAALAFCSSLDNPPGKSEWAPQALKVLEQALADEDGRVRDEAARALSEIGLLKPASVIPTLTKALTDPSPAVRRTAAVGLLFAKGDKKSALKTLDALLADPSATVRGETALALSMAGAESAARLTKLLDAKEPAGVRVRAAAALWRLNKDEAAGKMLAEALEEPGLRNVALDAMRERPPATIPAALKALALEPEPAVRRKARELLKRLNANPDEGA